MPKGYFNGKQIEKVYLGSDVIYRKAALPIVRVMELKQVHIDAALNKNISMYLNDVVAQVGDIVYSNDTLRVKAIGNTFKRAPSYYQNEPRVTYQTNFEIYISDSEYATKFPYGYYEERAWSLQFGFNFPMN